MQCVHWDFIVHRLSDGRTDCVVNGSLFTRCQKRAMPVQRFQESWVAVENHISHGVSPLETLLSLSLSPSHHLLSTHPSIIRLTHSCASIGCQSKPRGTAAAACSAMSASAACVHHVAREVLLSLSFACVRPRPPMQGSPIRTVLGSTNGHTLLLA